MIRLQRVGVIAALNMLVLAGLAVGASPASAAVTCQPNAPAPSNQYPGSTVVATNFESGSLTASGFRAPVTGGTGIADVSSNRQRSGRCAARLHVTTAAGSVANFSASLPAASKDIYADGWFNVAAQGPANNNVPYFRFFNGSTRVADVFRANSASGALWLRVTSPTGTYSYTQLRPSVALGTWHHLVMHVVPNGASTTIETWFDDQLVYSSRQVATRFNTLTAVQLGAEHRRQAGVSYIDDVVIKSGTSATAAPRQAGMFTPLAATRLLDTRTTSPVAADSPVSFQVAGVGGVPAQVASVVFNLTVTDSSSFGFITAYASGTGRPNASNLNFATRQTVPNLVTVPVGADGKVTLFNRSSGSAHLIADVTGFNATGTPAAAGAFRSLAPSRMLDTRTASPVAADSPVSFQVAGANGIPASVAAVVFNLTVTEAKSFGFATAYASGSARPNASNLNFAAGQTVPNMVTVPVGADGKVTLFNRSSGTAQFIADVAGYYLPGTPSLTGAFKALGPSRMLDTRTASAVAQDSEVSFQVAGANGIPAGVSAAVFNLTVTAPQSFGFVTAYASGSARPNASNLNFAVGQTVPNLVAVPVGADGKVTLFNRSAGTSQFIADVAGYYLP
ncbi:MAG: hypothetical protein JWO49_1375 [Arthrobacter sp.]|nr:hypothetical protein [Arthrobacter sp.]MCU1547074.1 hypothetical protein [Arthrobacter sp.]